MNVMWDTDEYSIVDIPDLAFFIPDPAFFIPDPAFFLPGPEFFLPGPAFFLTGSGAFYRTRLYLTFNDSEHM